MIDLTTLEGADTPGKVRHLAAKAVCPDPTRPEIPSCAAVCVYPALVPRRRARRSRGTGVAVASVATGFPSGQTSLEVKVEETREAVAAGATEIDMVISRDAYLSGDDAPRRARDRARSRRPAATAHLKVILETAELPTYAHVRHASQLAIDAGADFIKTSTGKATTGRDAGRRAGDARDGARPRLAHRQGHRRQGRGRRQHDQAGAAHARAGQGDAGRRVADAATASASAPRRCSTTCCMQYAKLDGGHYGRAEDFSKE